MVTLVGKLEPSVPFHVGYKTAFDQDVPHNGGKRTEMALNVAGDVDQDALFEPYFHLIALFYPVKITNDGSQPDIDRIPIKDASERAGYHRLYTR
jgi:hypothetical protein